FFFSSRRRHTRSKRDWSSDVCSSDLGDGSEVWSAGIEGRRLKLWPLMGGAPRNFLDESAAEVAWSPDGTRLVYHTWQAGDPTFVADHNGANQRLILQNEPGLHNHYQVWSKDGGSIYF